MTRLGFLHTAQVHVATFEALVNQYDGPAECLHEVNADLLDLARRDGVTTGVENGVLAALQRLADGGADVLVCTCSTLGPVAEGFAGRLPVPVVRVDRPMARRAVEAGDRIAVVAALESTLAPTRALLEDEAHRAGRRTSITEVCVPGAWEAFEAGDLDEYLGQIAAGARSLADHADVVVLAQASMLGAVEGLADLGLPVLASPQLAVRHALEAASWSSGGGAQSPGGRP